MEFKNIDTAKFDIAKPPKPYPESSPDRNGDYDNQDKDFSKSSSFSPEDSSNIHSRCDVDSSAFANHHTLGIGPYQSAKGNHIHDGHASRKIGAGLGLTVTGSKGGNAALTSLLAMLATVIEFTDSTT